jgi:myo-inositol-1(or 4)-monophosphatase
VPSLALRLARIAEGLLDGGLISPDSRDWDLVAASLILEEAGGKLTLTDGRPLVFNAERPMHPTLLASNGSLHPALVKAAAAARARFSSR